MSFEFHSSNFEFNEIIFQGKVGGQQAVRQYINMRIKMLYRHYGNAMAANLDVSHHINAIEALNLTSDLLNEYVNFDISSDIE